MKKSCLILVLTLLIVGFPCDTGIKKFNTKFTISSLLNSITKPAQAMQVAGPSVSAFKKVAIAASSISFD